MEHRDDLKGQYCGASKYQCELLDMWWKQWKQQGFASLLPYSHLKNDRQRANIREGDVSTLNHDNMVYGSYRLSKVMRNEVTVSGQTRTVKVGYEEGLSLANRTNEPTPQKEIVVSIKRMVLLAPIDKVELLRMSANYDFWLSGACCPELSSDVAE